MKEVKVYELSDGTLVTDKSEAIRKQARIDFETKVEEFADRTGVYDGKNQIREAILDNTEELLVLMNLYLELKKL